MSDTALSRRKDDQSGYRAGSANGAGTVAASGSASVSNTAH
ncbi:hypothetical protein SAMCFNEI73_pB0333 (plasmid) [Sinorhizobium americanum]|uniref:Uncharacterized protein n=1 Tax=Sinorhizobium americanum TaxID=194963 RepID=A0A1L3LTY7_9HYPH|nr:hypothetical protein SAMCFNEI73_pB0333 [Sinorhizobium americanum]